MTTKRYRNNHQVKQEREIQRSHSDRAAVLLHVRLDRDRSHHRNNMQEKNYVPNKWIRRLMPQEDFEIGPHDLRGQPHTQAPEP